MPIVWVPFNPDTGFIKPDINGNKVGYVVGYLNELGKQSDFPDCEVFNNIIIPNFIPRFDTEEIKNFTYDDIVKTTNTYTYQAVSENEALTNGVLNPGYIEASYGYAKVSSSSVTNQTVNQSINIDNKNSVTNQISTWLTTKYDTVLKTLPGFYIVTIRELVNDYFSSSVMTGNTGNNTTVTTTKNKQKEIIKGLRKLPRQIIKFKVRD